ncbi:MAG: PDZ domain-containing protein [Actinomycetia bacterium]|nr:PDZ domain-containing protein [Actinomycetes bacterium]
MDESKPPTTGPEPADPRRSGSGVAPTGPPVSFPSVGGEATSAPTTAPVGVGLRPSPAGGNASLGSALGPPSASTRPPATPPSVGTASAARPSAPPVLPSNPVGPSGGVSSTPPAGAPSRSWGWRHAAAFLAGGALVAGGFVLGRTTDGTQTVTADATSPAVEADTSSSGSPANELPLAGGSSSSGTTGEGAVTAPPISGESNEPVAAVAAVIAPAVVQISTDTGVGSGVIYDAAGLILTNHHVVDGSSQVVVTFSDGSSVPGTVRGSDARVDIAVVEIAPPSGLTVAALALDEPLDVGQLAVAVGSPFGLDQTVTSGIVSAVGRSIPSGDGPVTMVQTDAPINPGNSGGALADRQGRVIGINTSIRSNSGTNTGVGFAVPIDTAYDMAQRILAGDSQAPGYLGISGTNVSTGESGALITELVAGAPASASGLEVGDRVIAIDDRAVGDMTDLAALVRGERPGMEVDLTIDRDGQELTIGVVLGAADG